MSDEEVLRVIFGGFLIVMGLYGAIFTVVAAVSRRPAKVKSPVPVSVPEPEPCPYCYPDCTCHLPPVDPRPCGSNEPHYEDFTDRLRDKLDVGQVYETVAARESVRCSTEGGSFWMAWIRSYADDKCCGIDELVAFDNKPPKQFVFSLNGKIIEVYGDGLRNTG